MSGIVELPADAPVGAPAAEVMGLADPIIDVAVTPNRGDCLGVRGIARDLAAAGLGALRAARHRAGRRAASKARSACASTFAPEAASACPYFAGRLIRGVRNAESPRWLQDRLLAAGLRPISALVDITNYLTLDLCRPLHVFDADKLAGGIQVRLAHAGERLLALNGKEYELGPEMTVVADGAGAQALGGVIGGEPTACTETTTNVFVESALFDPVRTAMTGRALNVAVRRPLPLRARRRSDLGELGPGGRDAADPRHLRRRALDRGRRRKSAAGALSDRLPAEPGAHAGGSRGRRRRVRPRAGGVGLRGRVHG